MAPVAKGRERFTLATSSLTSASALTGPSGDIVLPRLSFELLLVLLRRAPDLVSNEELSTMVWADVVVSPETVTKRVNLLRDALGDNRRILATSPAFGRAAIGSSPRSVP